MPMNRVSQTSGRSQQFAVVVVLVVVVVGGGPQQVRATSLAVPAAAGGPHWQSPAQSEDCSTHPEPSQLQSQPPWHGLGMQRPLIMGELQGPSAGGGGVG